MFRRFAAAATAAAAVAAALMGCAAVAPLPPVASQREVEHMPACTATLR